MPDPVTAMTNVGTWCGTPSTTNTCLLKIMPGTYDLGSGTLAMQQFVDVEGSGENATVITGAVNTTYPPTNGTVNGASNAEIRFLTVKNTGTGSYAAAILNIGNSPRINNVTATATASGGIERYGVCNSSSSSPTITNVTATASGGMNGFGVYNNSSSSPIMTNVIATASGSTNSFGVYNKSSSSPVMTSVSAIALGGSDSYGVFNSSSSPTMTNVTATAKNGATANYGMYNSAPSGSYTILIDRSTFEGATNSISNETEFTLKIGASKLVGPANTAGTITYDYVDTDSGIVMRGANVGIGTMVPTEALDIAGNLKVSGTITGDGTGLTNMVPADGSVTDAKISGPISGSKLGSHTHSGANIASGTVIDARLSANVDLLNATQTVTGAKTFSAQIASTVATGTAPLQVTSTTLVPNLNAEMVGGQKMSDLDLRYITASAPNPTAQQVATLRWDQVRWPRLHNGKRAP